MNRDLEAVEKAIEELRDGYSEDVCFVVEQALRIEQEKIHLVEPKGVVDQVLKVVTEKFRRKEGSRNET